jgi:5S rRNA maturation endonuclease (ribonuclease M5)
VISTAGANVFPDWLLRFHEQDYVVFCAFDADEAGDSMAHALISRFPSIQRIRPSLKDWNDLL